MPTDSLVEDLIKKFKPGWTRSADYITFIMDNYIGTYRELCSESELMEYFDCSYDEAHQMLTESEETNYSGYKMVSVQEEPYETYYIYDRLSNAGNHNQFVIEGALHPWQKKVVSLK